MYEVVFLRPFVELDRVCGSKQAVWRDGMEKSWFEGLTNYLGLAILKGSHGNRGAARKELIENRVMRSERMCEADSLIRGVQALRGEF
jgi:hypothetical protein